MITRVLKTGAMVARMGLTVLACACLLTPWADAGPEKEKPEGEEQPATDAEVRREIERIEAKIAELRARLKELQARLPDADDKRKILQEAVLELAADGAVVLSGKVLVGDDLIKKLRELATVRGVAHARIVADDHTEFEKVRVLWNLCREAGFSLVTFEKRGDDQREEDKGEEEPSPP